MSRLTTNLFFLSLFLTPVFANAGGRTVVHDTTSFYRATQEACVGQTIGASCTVYFQGGSVSFGICVQVPGPAGGYLTCQLDTQNLGCRKNSLTGSPTTAAMLLALAGGLLLWSRRRARV